MTGELRVRLPILFTDILFLYSDTLGDKVIHEARTGGDAQRQFLRCSIPFAEPVYDFTLTSFDPYECRGQGLARMYSL